MDQILSVIFDNLENEEGINIVHPLVLKSAHGDFDTTPFIIKKITDDFSANGHVDVICYSEFLDGIEEKDTVDGLGNRLEIVFAPTDHKEQGVLSHAFFGDFYRTLSRLYNIPVTKNEQQTNTLISIVIPTRNNPVTLEYTLKTCLQDSGNDFEIIINDNSSAGNEETFNLIERINDPRIKYFRPDRELLLKENFEFAYCLAKGEFIFSIDTIVLKWTKVM